MTLERTIKGLGIALVTLGLTGMASANLLLNSGFEEPDIQPPDTLISGATDWATFNTAGVTTLQQYSGDQSLRLAPNAPTGTGHGIARQGFAASANETYSFGAWVFHPSDDPITGPRKLQLRIQWLNASNTLINQQILDVLDAGSPTDVWQFVKLEDVTLPNNANITQVRAALMVINNGGTGGGAAYIDDAVFVEGSVVPEPSTVCVLGLGCLVIAAARRRVRVA